ncbi:glycine cleavage system aminomethyltransferase GcvT [Microbacterium sp. BR1]|uniref:glycine cleavage system aminomethyltransferase GcvT n=1 Tax=Microbacterium sp. BR1 TaxID=1070896 RepID=UPI000C2CA30C
MPDPTPPPTVPPGATTPPPSPESAPPRRTPLAAAHERLGASFTDFGGWWMPVRYSSELAEHHAVRTAAGLFDISHMAEFVVTGQKAGEFLDYALSGRPSAMRLGKAAYGLVLAEQGGIVDDVIVYRLADDHFVVIANAGNRDAVAAALAQRAASVPAPGTSSTDAGGSFGFVAGEPGFRLEDVSDDTALIAVQGPVSAAVLEATEGLVEFSPLLDDLGYYAAATARFDGAPVLVARTGYTGEDGFELAVPVARAEELWEALLAAGEPLGLVPAGLAARDTLRLEAGMPLYGHELSLDIRPAQAGLVRAVATEGDFVGREGASAPLDPDARVLVGLASEGRRAGRAGYAVFAGEAAAGTEAGTGVGTEVGIVTSGALSPTLGHPIALAYVDPGSAEPGTPLFIDVRGTRIPATVTPTPFYRRKK